ncbi:1-aminocyclopropane-1-carboxylate deaminase/D-cysteine desulfhydrase [Methylobacter sp.]|uniref:1-aminocyclopropane-1-carboxylate deaminase/D-cysteine desulfhydrase n=1 Tax=Methylobacter sp. TaxID=2051955 RepID=UPI003DA5A11A
MHPELIQLEKTFDKSILSRIQDPMLDHYGIELWVKRDDLLHPVISGNKWRKLKYILDHALSIGAHTLISMGGAYSNHLHALAYVGRELGLKTIGLIRGEQPDTLNPTLVDMRNWGMELKFVSRSGYRDLRHYKDWQDLPGIKPRQYWLPEGGAQTLALKGVAELVREIDMPYDMLCVPCGTGTTLAGIIEAVPESVSVMGFAALKNAGFLTADVESLLSRPYANWQINPDYHFGGFAQVNAGLMAFIEAFELKTHVPLEPVYTGKMLYGLYDLIAQGCFKPGQRIIAVHTGGLQGKRGFD